MNIDMQLTDLLRREHGMTMGDAAICAYVIQAAPIVARVLGHSDNVVLAGELMPPQATYLYWLNNFGVAVWQYADMTSTTVCDAFDEVLVTSLTPVVTEHDTVQWTGQLLTWQPGEWLTHFGELVIRANGVRV